VNAEQDNTARRSPDLCEQRSPEVQEQFDALASRVRGLGKLSKRARAELQALEGRLKTPRQLAERLEQLADGTDPQVQPLIEEARGDYQRQADRLNEAAVELARRRRRLIALARAHLLNYRAVVLEGENRDAYYHAARDLAQSNQQAYQELADWLEQARKRWQPRNRPPAETPSMKDILALLPDLDAEQSAAQPADRTKG